MKSSTGTTVDVVQRGGNAKAPSQGISGAARRRLRRLADSGQATAEYALVLVGVAFIGVLVLDWARNTNMIGRLLNTVFRSITKLIT